MKGKAVRAAFIANLMAIGLMLGNTAAISERDRKTSAKWRDTPHARRRHNRNGFGGPKRAGIKLVRKMMRAGAKTK